MWAELAWAELVLGRVVRNSTHPPRCNRTHHRDRHLVSDFMGAAILDLTSLGPPSWIGSRGGRHLGSDVVTSFTL